MSTAKVLLVDDHAVVRQGIRALLSREPDIDVVGEAENGRQALDRIAELAPNVILMDISMPGLNGIDATRQMQERYPTVKVIVLSMHSGEEYVFQVLRAGASGYVLKQSDSIEVLTAIRAVLAGGSFLSPPISRTLIDDYIRRADVREQRDVEDDPLTPREREVLQLLAEGLPNRRIAKRLSISVKTVESHRSNMMHKLGVRGKTDLVKYALRRGWATLQE